MAGIKSECAGCLECFNGVTAFEAHRTGNGVHRRCMTPIEMRRAGFTRGKWDRWDLVSDPFPAPGTGSRTERKVKTA